AIVVDDVAPHPAHPVERRTHGARTHPWGVERRGIEGHRHGHPTLCGALHDLGVIHAHPEGLLGQGAHRSTHDPHRVLLIERVVVGRTRRGGVARGELGSPGPTT